jgi:methylenetetrahydrofolate reductase (NADPH)
MVVSTETGKILVVSSIPDLLEMVKTATGGTVEVTCALDYQEGLDKARKELPDMIVVGYIEPQGSAFTLHNKLREGWITKYIPLLLVDAGSPTNALRVLSLEEGMQIEADEYIALPEVASQASLSLLTEQIGRLRDKLITRLRERANTVKEAILDPDTFCITWEQVAGRGAFELQQEEIIENARTAARRGRVHAVSVTDNPGGNPAISTEIICTEVRKLGIEPLVHLAFRDKNRNVCESLLYGLAALGVRNLLLLTGDYPSSGGFQGRAKPVFDMDSVHGLQLVEMMNQGMDQEVMGRKSTLAPTDFFAGASVSPFKQREAELMGQYYKLKKKIEAGARFIIPQLGYDARKFHEVLQWLKVNGYNVPVLANVYVLPYGAARTMNSNQIPGAVVTDKLLADIDQERKSEDKGRTARLTRAAKMYAIARGMGFAGAHIGGHGLTYEMLEFILDKGEELVPNWRDLVAEFDYPQPGGFYFFEKDPETGLNSERVTRKTQKPRTDLVYWLSRMAHHTIFNPESPLFKMLRPFAVALDKSGWPKRLFGWSEHLAKTVMFGCMNCGDCALFDISYLCPMSRCPKNQRNGPCGGSHDGWCEVYPNERKCIWVKAYERLRANREEDTVADNLVPPVNWELWETSSWLNFYNGRDHSARRLGVKPPGKKDETSTDQTK